MTYIVVILFFIILFFIIVTNLPKKYFPTTDEIIRETGKSSKIDVLKNGHLRMYNLRMQKLIINILKEINIGD